MSWDFRTTTGRITGNWGLPFGAYQCSVFMNWRQDAWTSQDTLYQIGATSNTNNSSCRLFQHSTTGQYRWISYNSGGISEAQIDAIEITGDSTFWDTGSYLNNWNWVCIRERGNGWCLSTVGDYLVKEDDGTAQTLTDHGLRYLSFGGSLDNTNLANIEIANIAIWDRYLETDDILNFHDRVTPLDIASESLTAFYSLSENDTTPNEETGNGGPDLSISGGAYSSNDPGLKALNPTFQVPISYKSAKSWKIDPNDVNDQGNNYGPNANRGFPSSNTAFTAFSIIKTNEIPASPDWRIPVGFQTNTSTHVCKLGLNVSGTLDFYHQLELTTGGTKSARFTDLTPTKDKWYLLIHKWSSGNEYKGYAFELEGEFGNFTERLIDVTNAGVFTDTIDLDAGRYSFAANGGGSYTVAHHAYFPLELSLAEVTNYALGRIGTTDQGDPDIRLRFDKVTLIDDDYHIIPDMANGVNDVKFESGPKGNESTSLLPTPVQFSDINTSLNEISFLPIIKKNTTKHLPNNPILDLENPINRDIALCVCPGIYGALNLVNGKSGTNYGKNFHGGRYGMSKSLFNGESAIADSATNYLKGIPYTAVNTEMTIAWVGRADLKANDCGLLGSREGTGNYSGFMFWTKGTSFDATPYFQVTNGSGNDLDWANGPIDFMDTTGSPDDPGYDMIAVVRYNGDGLSTDAFSAYFNGVYREGGSSVGMVRANGTSISMGAFYDYSGWYSQHGKSTLGVYWDRAVSDDELACLARNPFQIFKTVQSRMIATDVTSYTKFARIPTKRGR